MEHEDAFERLTRKLDDYHKLLVFGQVQRRVDDPDAWRREIRAQARRDKVAVRTFAFESNGVAALRMRESKDDDLRRAMELYYVQLDAADRAKLLSHEISRWLRANNGEAAARCSRCGAHLYVDSRVDPPILDGEVFEAECR